jgi:hypothetical protein
MSGSFTIFSKPVDSVEEVDGKVTVIKHKTLYTFVNAACIIKETGLMGGDNS